MRITRSGGWRQAAFLLAAMVAATLLAACSGSKPELSVPELNLDEMRGAQVSPPYEKPAATLTGTDGKPFDLRAETDGSITLLFVGYTHCPDICPTHMHDIAKAMKDLDPKDRKAIRTIFVTADPERDTPEALGDWLAFFDPSFVGLTGSKEEVGELLAQLGMEHGKQHDIGNGNYVVDHAAYVIAFGRDNSGRLVYPLGVTIDDWKHDLALLAERG